ncbi:MAG TPA: hypothetical protein VKU80_15495 [Planctomycetota bacterium]|nr:hypothetical protein [Planctomycetota bacterium]
MAALTAAKQTPLRGEIKTHNFPIKAGAKVFGGGFCAVDATGYLVDASDTAGLKIVGVVLGEPTPGIVTGTAGVWDNTSGANGAFTVPVCYECEAHVVGAGFTQAGVGLNALCVDDQTVQTGATTNNIKVGKVLEFVSATEVVIYVPGLSDLT